MPFVELSALKTIMRIPPSDTSRDAELQIYADYANSYLYGALGGLTESVPTSYSDTTSIDESYQTSVWCRRYPVISVTSVINDTNTLDPAKYTFTDLGCIRLVNNYDAFAFGVSTVTVNYVAGFAAGDPALGELKIAGLTLASYTANIASRAGISSEKIGQYSYDIGAAMGGIGNAAPGGFGIPPMVERILAKWDRGFMVWPTSY
jgi:hypothetical protein